MAFQAISLSVWTISRDSLVSVGSPFLVVFSYATRYSSVYPVIIMSTSNTHGAIGLSLFLLTIALIGSGKRQAGLFLLGLLPSVHLSIALLSWLVVLTCFCFATRELIGEIRKHTKYLLIGLCFSLLSLLIHYHWIYAVPYVEPTVTRKYFDGFIRLWDYHRKPVEWNQPGIYLNCATILIGLIWSTAFGRRLNTGASFLLRCLSIAGIFGLTCAALSQLPPENLPQTFLTLMPSRILEFTNFAFVSLFLGLCSIYRKNIYAQLLMTIFIAVAMIEREITWKTMLIVSAALILLPALIEHQKLRFFANKNWPAQFLRSTSIAFLAYAAISIGAKPDLFHSEPAEWRLYNLQDRSNDTFFESASHRSGMLLTASDLHLIQLRTRRPVLLDGGQLDMLPYIAEAGPQLAKILKEIYGLDFFAPPIVAIQTATIPVSPVKQVWESRSETAWKAIGKKYGVTEVLTYSNWKLNLPLINNNGSLSSYAIPN